MKREMSMIPPNEVVQNESDYVVQSYIRPDFVLVRGEGMTLYDAEDNPYVDWVSGIAVNALGYNHEGINNAIQTQANTGVIHTSNLYHTVPHTQLAKSLVEKSFADKIFFCNSGAEANEGAIKFARRHADNPEKHVIITFEGGFHGRTMGALAVTPRDKYQKPFLPLMPGVRVAKFNDLDSVKPLMDEQVCAIIIEPIQGEGGVHPTDAEFLQGLRVLCDEHDALLIFDEVQCGVGRTGTLWAHEYANVSPDIMTLAKPLAGGLPIGAICVTESVAQSIKPGDHGSTFAGGLMVTNVADYVVNTIAEPEFLEHVNEVGEYLMEHLAELNSPHIVEVRGRGLMCAIEFDMPVGDIVSEGYEHGLLLVNAGANVLRFVPPLIAQKSNVDQLIQKLTLILEKLPNE